MFGRDQYAPARREGQWLLAHELAHVAQQRPGSPSFLRRDIRTDVQHRSVTAAELRQLSDKELEGLLVFVEKLLEPPNPEDPALLENYGTIRSVWADQHSRGDAPGAEASRPGVQSAADKEAPAAGRGTPNVTAPNPLVKAMSVFASIRPSDQASGIWKGNLDGRTITLNEEQYGKLHARVVEEANKAIRRASLRAETAAGRYAEQQKVDAHHWIIAPIVKTLGRVSDPGPALAGYVEAARVRLGEAKSALGDDNFSAVARLTGEGEAAAEQAGLMVAAYVDQIIGSAEMTVTVLEGIKTASEGILFLCAIAATGGLAGAGATALGLEGVAGTTTLLGVTGSTAAWATASAPPPPLPRKWLSASPGQPMATRSLGTILAHAAIQVIVAKLSPGAGQQLTKQLGKVAVFNHAVRALIARIGMQRVVTVATTVLLHEGTQIFSTAVEDTIAALRGKPITWGEFADRLFQRLRDPKGLLMATVAGSLGGLQPEPEPGAPAKPASGGQPGHPRNPPPTTEISGTSVEELDRQNTAGQNVQHTAPPKKSPESQT